MKKDLIAKIDKLIEASRADLAADTIKLVNIKSVQGEPLPGAPFGEGPRRVLDAVMEMGKNEGFYITDYQVGVVSVALKEGQPDLGIWVHGDVVPEGDGWSFEPYNAVEYEGCIIGRGATDNKGQLAAIFHLLKIFKELGIKLHYNPAIYVGSNEERGMKDMIGIPGNPDAKGFLNVCKAPRLSLVPDGGFPVGNGGKGCIKMVLKSTTPLHGLRLMAGQEDSPGRGTAIFDNLSYADARNIPDELAECSVKKGETIELITQSAPIHSSKPDPNGNMITKLAKVLLDNRLIVDEDRYILDFFKKVSLNTDGAMFHINVKTDTMTPLTLAATKVNTVDGYPELNLNIFYPIEITCEEIVERISMVCVENGFIISNVVCGYEPYLLDANSEIVKRLSKIANEVTGEDVAPYTVGGVTYAHRLPNALVYGMNGNLAPKDFTKGRGGAHGIDEAVSLDRLQRAMKIYARALLELNEMEW